LLRNRWFQLLIGLICMMAISSPQYVWTLFTKPLTAKLGVPLSELQITFSMLIVLQTFFSPFQGSLIERFGARRLIAIGTFMSGLSWVLAAQASSIGMFYLAYGLVGGLGTGIVYVGVVGQMVRWFPDRRGFAVGMVAAGYGMGAILTTFPISASLASAGLETTLWQFGLVFAAIGVIASQALRSPDASHAAAMPAPAIAASTHDLAPRQMLRTPLFWLMFAMMTMMSTSGLMVTSQMATFARDFGVANVMVFGLAALPLALTIDRLTNGLTRPSSAGSRTVTAARTPCSSPSPWKAWPWPCGWPRARTRCCSCCCRAWCSSAGAKSFALPLHPDRHLRHPQRHRQLWLAVYLARHRLHLRRPAGGDDA
jgi:MFS family permease